VKNWDAFDIGMVLLAVAGLIMLTLPIYVGVTQSKSGYKQIYTKDNKCYKYVSTRAKHSEYVEIPCPTSK